MKHAVFLEEYCMFQGGRIWRAKSAPPPKETKQLPSGKVTTAALLLYSFSNKNPHPTGICALFYPHGNSTLFGTL